MKHGRWWVAVVSARRPARVRPMSAQLGGVTPTWYVGADEGAVYEAAGAERVSEAGGLVAARNAALTDAWAAGLACVQVSDDLASLAWYDGQQKRPLTFTGALAAMDAALDATGARLAGVSPTANPFFYRTPLSRHLFVVGDFVMARPCGLYYDPKLRLKEDYDYTLQHLAAYGQVARVNGVLAVFKHRSNPGGAVTYRTPQAEQEAIAYLQSKWGAAILPNRRRPNEVLLRWRPTHA